MSAQDYQKGYDAYQAGDYATALKEFRLLAEQGNALLQTVVGDMHRKGKGVPQNYAGAVKLYRLAAEQGNAEAQNNLAVSYATGKGLIQDYVMAHMWWNLANANGNETGGINRDRIAEDMTNADIEKAVAMAQECFNSVYAKCGY